MEVHLELGCVPQTAPGGKGLVTTALAKPQAGGRESSKDSRECRFAGKKKRGWNISLPLNENTFPDMAMPGQEQEEVSLGKGCWSPLYQELAGFRDGAGGSSIFWLRSSLVLSGNQLPGKRRQVSTAP